MKVLVTGAAGYIGDAAVSFGLRFPYVEITAMDSLMYGGAYMRTNKRLKFVRGDIRDLRLMEKLVREHDAVLHLAAIVGDAACQANPELTTTTNLDATEHLAALCRAYDKSLIFASTCSVYGANNDELDEESPTNPLSLYAGTKLRAEDAVCDVDSHFIFRLGTLFGLSATYGRLRCDLVANIMTYRALSGQKLTVYGGDQWRPLLHVKDAGEIMMSAAISSRDSQLRVSPGTYILAHTNYKMIDLAQEILSACELPSDMLAVTEMPFEDQRNYKVSEERLGSVWQARRDLKSGLREMINIVKEGRIANLWNPAYHNAKWVQEAANV